MAQYSTRRFQSNCTQCVAMCLLSRNPILSSTRFVNALSVSLSLFLGASCYLFFAYVFAYVWIVCARESNEFSLDLLSFIRFFTYCGLN